MECRDISGCEFELILAELVGASRSDGSVETITGQHEVYGATVLVRDGSRCMALIDNPDPLDRLLAMRAFLMDGAAAVVSGSG